MKTLFLVLDTVRRDYLGFYGNNWVQTPNLDRLAGAGFAFDNHWVGSLPCMPARREFMTGRHNFLDRGWGADRSLRRHPAGRIAQAEGCLSPSDHRSRTLLRTWF